MLDSIGPFKKKKQLLKQLNCYQFFKSRYGIGHSLSLIICNFSGLHPSLRMHKFIDNYFNSYYSNFYVLKRIKYFFINNKQYFDHFLHKIQLNDIDILKSIKSLRGKRHSSFLPVRGQRNRTNGRTRKKIYLGNTNEENKKRK